MKMIVNNGDIQVGSDENMLTGSNVNLLIFPEYREFVDETTITTYVNLSENIIKLSGKEHLTKEAINQIKEIYIFDLNGTLYPGGQDTFFAWSFDHGEYQLLLKPYSKKELIPLFLHYLTIEELGNTLTCTINQKAISVKIPPVIGFATITTETHLIPILITLESVGEPIMKHPKVIKILSNITKKMASKGVIIDPYPANWRVHSSKSRMIIEYIDIINSNKLSNVEERIKALLYSLTQLKCGKDRITANKVSMKSKDFLLRKRLT